MFQSPAGDSPDRICSICGADPSLDLLETPKNTTNDSGIPARKSKSKQHGHREKRSASPYQSRHFMLKLCGAWLLVLALIVLVARKFWHEEAPVRKSPVSPVEAPAMSGDDFALLDNSLNECARTFAQFLAAGTPEARNQFVLRPVTTASKMARYYNLNPLITVDPATLKLASSSVLNLPDGKAIETSWTAAGGTSFDAVFCKDHDEWLLDWDHFSRYSDDTWSLFLAGCGPAHAEFRLLARERLADSRKDASDISLVLYAPRVGHPDVAGFHSPEFLISRTIRDGKRLDTAFKLARSGGRIFSSKLPNMDPDGMIRVRVKVRRSEVATERKFEITEVLACHWYAIDNPGVEPGGPNDVPSQAR